MTRETEYIKIFNKLLNDESQKAVKQILQEYIHTAYHSKRSKDVDAVVLSYFVTYEHYWALMDKLLHQCTYNKGDAKRQMIYVSVEYADGTTDTFRMSAKNVKKFIRNHRSLQMLLTK